MKKKKKVARGILSLPRPPRVEGSAKLRKRLAALPHPNCRCVTIESPIISDRQTPDVIETKGTEGVPCLDWHCPHARVRHSHTPGVVAPRVVQDNVNHPAHYGGPDNPYEAIKVIEAWRLGFNLGNAVKYIARAKHKGAPLEDLKKARWYLDREISNREER